MKGMTIAAICAAVDGQFTGDESLLSKEVTMIHTDSRQLKPGGLFVALPGERVDGHDFIAKTVSAGAIAAIAEKDMPDDLPVIRVESSAMALKQMARLYLDILDIPVVGITGSVGKTSTKEMIAAVLSQKFNVHKTAGNYNNEIGLPLTVFGLEEDHEAAVLEMGISEFEEMDRLSEVARPNVMVITNIGVCHLENLGSRDGVLKAKTECFEHLGKNAKVILNADDDKLASINKVKGASLSFYGVKNDEAQVSAKDVKALGVHGMEAHIVTGEGEFAVKIPLIGEHNIYNALAATAVGLEFGMEIAEIQKGIESVKAVPGRGYCIECGEVTVLDDAYNANPASVISAIDVLSVETGRTVAILGDMGELGENERAMHYEVGAHLGKEKIPLLFTVGELALEYTKGARHENPSVVCKSFETKEALYPVLARDIRPGDTVLVKASHFMEFDRIVSFLKESFGE